MRTKYNKRRFRTLIMIVVILLCMSIGYSYLLTTLNIEGISNIKANTWDVHWENVNVKSGSVTGDQVPIAAHILGDTTQVEYSVILENPGDYYEFTVDAKNAGSLDAMVSIVDTKFYESNGVTQISLPYYLEYECLYSGNVAIEPNQLLTAGSSKTLIVKLKFKDDLDEVDLPTTDKTIVIRQSITYIQADENAVETANTRFEQDSWEDIVGNVLTNHADYYDIGDTKEVDMGTLGTHTIRIANKSTPAECSATGFSQTACGFVLEFVDIITTHRMNSTDTNVGGWPASELRTYVNSDIYNALPTELKNGIINTTVVSGHGNTSGETNFTSTDKLYLLSVHEVWEKEGTNNFDRYDTAWNQTRQLDYYSSQNITKSSYAGAIKQSGGSNVHWWLRSARSTGNTLFYGVDIYGSWFDSRNSSTVGGVPPAFRLSDDQN